MSKTGQVGKRCCARQERTCDGLQAGSTAPSLPAPSLAPALTTDVPLVKLGTTEPGPWSWPVSCAAVIRGDQSHCSHSNRTFLQKGSTRKAPPMAPVPGCVQGSQCRKLQLARVGQGTQLLAPHQIEIRDSKIEARTLPGHGLVPTLPRHMPPRQGPGPGAQADCPALTSGPEISLQ